MGLVSAGDQSTRAPSLADNEPVWRNPISGLLVSVDSRWALDQVGSSESEEFVFNFDSASDDEARLTIKFDQLGDLSIDEKIVQYVSSYSGIAVFDAPQQSLGNSTQLALSVSGKGLVPDVSRIHATLVQDGDLFWLVESYSNLSSNDTLAEIERLRLSLLATIPNS